MRGAPSRLHVGSDENPITAMRPGRRRHRHTVRNCRHLAADQPLRLIGGTSQTRMRLLLLVADSATNGSC